MPNEKETTNVAEGGTAAVESSRKLTPVGFILKYNALVLLLILIIVSSIMSPMFLSYMNIVNVFRQQATYLIVAMGLMICMSAGGVDLSLATTIGLGCCMLTEFNMVYGIDIVPAILLTILLSAVVGALNGILVAYLRMQPFIVTLCMSFALTGVVYLITKGVNRQFTGAGAVLSNGVKVFLIFGQEVDPLLGMPWIIYLALITIIAAWFTMKYTAFGRLITATGSNPMAAILAGIDIRKYRLAGHIIASTMAGISGIVITARTGASAPSTINGDYTMIAIAATIIGGSSLNGGSGSVPFSVVGIFVMGLINNIMNLSNIPAYPQYIVKALVIILAIFARSLIDSKKD